MKYETYLSFIATRPDAMKIVFDRLLMGLSEKERRQIKSKEFENFSEFCRDFTNAIIVSNGRLS